MRVRPLAVRRGRIQVRAEVEDPERIVELDAAVPTATATQTTTPSAIRKLRSTLVMSTSRGHALGNDTYDDRVDDAFRRVPVDLADDLRHDAAARVAQLARGSERALDAGDDILEALRPDRRHRRPASSR